MMIHGLLSLLAAICVAFLAVFAISLFGEFVMNSYFDDED